MSKIETPVDLEVTLHELLPDVDLENYLAFDEDEKQFIIRIMCRLSKDAWTTIMAWVQEQNGDYNQPKRQWTLPKTTAEKNNSLPPQSSLQPEENMKISHIPLESLVPLRDSLKIRQHASEQKIHELAESIRTQGLIHPLKVRPLDDGKYEVATGNRRLKAIQKLGNMKTIPCIVEDLSDVDVQEQQFAENDPREDISDYGSALWIDSMLRNYPDRYPTQDALAKKIGKSQSWVAKRLRMLELITIIPVGIMLKLHERHARAILEAPSEKHKELATYIERHVEREGTPPSPREIKWEIDRITSLSPELHRKTQETNGDVHEGESTNPHKGMVKWIYARRKGWLRVVPSRLTYMPKGQHPPPE